MSLYKCLVCLFGWYPYMYLSFCVMCVSCWDQCRVQRLGLHMYTSLDLSVYVIIHVIVCHVCLSRWCPYVYICQSVSRVCVSLMPEPRATSRASYIYSRHHTFHMSFVKQLIQMSFGVCDMCLTATIYVSFAKEPYKTDYILQKRPII